MKRFKKTDKTLSEIKEILSSDTIDSDSEDRLDDLICKGIDNGREQKILDIIKNTVNDEVRAIAGDIFEFSKDTILDIVQDADGNLYDVSCFAIPMVNVAIKDARWEPHLQTHELKLPPGDALAKTFREAFELAPDTTVVLLNGLVTAEYLSKIDAKGWRDFMKSVIRYLAGEEKSVILPKVAKIDNSLRDIDEDKILLINRCMIGVIIYNNMDDFDRLIDASEDRLNKWGVIFKNALMEELGKTAPVEMVSVASAITTTNDVVDISMSLLEAIEEDMAMASGKLKKFVFYTYENWHARFKERLAGKTGQEIAAMYSAFLGRYYKEVKDHLNVNKETTAIFLKADTKKMIEYINSHELDPEDESSWKEAESGLLPIIKPLIETTITGADFHRGKNDITISMHGDSDQPYCLIAIIVTHDKKVAAQKFLWNTGAVGIKEALEALMKELKPYGKRVYEVEGDHAIVVCDCCHKLTGLVRDESKMANAGRIIH